MENYLFAKRVAVMFPEPWGAADLPPERQKEIVWESLILHYEGFRRGIAVSQEEMEATINEFLKGARQTFTRQGDPEAYRLWVGEQAREDVELFENQVRYLSQIRKLKDQVFQESRVSATEEELKEEFLNEKNHVGGEMVLFESKAEADDFYNRFRDPRKWNGMKASGKQTVRPVSIMTLEAYIELWGVPKEQMVAFHAMAIGSVGPPMPFGKQWCVYRLLEKRTGNLADFPKEKESYQKQVEMKKKYVALKQWISDLKTAANLKVFVK